MTEENSERKAVEHAPKAVIQTKRSFSIIWVVPIVALLIGGWLAFKSWSEKGPTITISFETAEGLEAGKTKIKYKDVEIGQVTTIDLAEDIKSVIVTAELHHGANIFLTDKTQFWVVRARVAAGEVSGLGTLFSGAYIGMAPESSGKPLKNFTGLEKPPAIAVDTPGRQFLLKAETLGSLDVGSPIYFRQIKVGQVADYDFDETANAVDIKIFIHDPFHQLVRKNTRFWNASGIDFRLNASGIKVDTQSMLSVMLGGLAFQVPKNEAPGESAEEGQVFKLYEDRDSINEKEYTIKRRYLMYFSQNVRGLVPGSPVEMLGVKVGEVVEVKLELDIKKMDIRIPVLVDFEPERIDSVISESGEKLDTKVERQSAMEKYSGDKELGQGVNDRMVAKGYRAQLKTGNILTGQLYIELAVHPDAPPAKIDRSGPIMIYPTIESPLEQIVDNVNRVVKKVEKIEFEKIGADLQSTIKNLDATLAELKVLTGNVNQEIVPDVHQTLKDLQETLADVQASIGSDSALNYNATRTLDELTLTIRSIRELTEAIERNPRALLFGKEKTENAKEKQ